MFSVLVMTIGAFLKNKPFNFFTAFKMIAFTRAASTCYVIGGEYINRFRGMNDTFILYWYDRMVVSFLGDTYNLRAMRSLRNNDNVPYKPWYNFFNTCVLEVLAIVILRVIALIKRDSKLITGLSKIYTLSGGVRVFIRACEWVKLEREVSKSIKTGETWDRKWLQYLITWVIWAVVLIIIAEAIINLFISAIQFGKTDGEKKRQAKYIEKKDGDSQEEYAFKHAPVMSDSVEKQNQDARLNVDLAYINPKRKKDLLGILFIPIWYTRWFVFVLLAYIFWKHPKTIFCIYWIIDLIMIGLAVISLKSLWSPLGLIYLLEEVFVFGWHLSLFIIWVDFYKGDFPGDGKMGDKGAKFWTWLIFILILLSILTEIIGWIAGMCSGMITQGEKSSNKENLGSDDMQLEIAESGTELNNKIVVYNTMRTKQAERAEDKKEDKQ